MSNSEAGGPGTARPASSVQAASSVQSVDRAVAILEILARDGEAGVTDVARELGVHKSTASRLLAALDRRELVTQDTARGKFRLGVGIVRLAGAASARLDVVQESRPVCRALAQQAGETVNLAILSGRDALYLDQAAGPAALSPNHWAGRRIPLHATSDGKVLLAYLPEDELAASLVPPLALHRAHRHRRGRVHGPAGRGAAAWLRHRGGRVRGRPDRHRGPGPGRRGPPRRGRDIPTPRLARPLARSPAIRGHLLACEDVAQLAGHPVRIAVEGRFEIAALGRGGVRGELAFQRAATSADLLRPGLGERGRRQEHHSREH